MLKPKQPNIVVQVESINNNNNAQTSDENNENVLTPPTNRSHQMPFQRRLSPQPQVKSCNNFSIINFSKEKFIFVILVSFCIVIHMV